MKNCNLKIGTRVTAKTLKGTATITGTIKEAIDLQEGNFLYVVSSFYLNGCGKPCDFGIFNTEIISIL